MTRGLPRPPSRCPTCGQQMIATGMTCPGCATSVAGRWSACECRYCRLSDDQRTMLEVFLTARGNTKELERHLGVSYPTARARLEALLVALGLAEPTPASEHRQSRLAVLQSLAEGGLTVDEAATALVGDDADRGER